MNRNKNNNNNQTTIIAQKSTLLIGSLLLFATAYACGYLQQPGTVQPCSHHLTGLTNQVSEIPTSDTLSSLAQVQPPSAFKRPLRNKDNFVRVAHPGQTVSQARRKNTQTMAAKQPNSTNQNSTNQIVVYVGTQTATPPPMEAAPMEIAYKAFMRADYAAANKLYYATLSQEPHHLDALLGAAAVAIRQNRLAEATTLYRRTLAHHPQNPIATAALVNLAPEPFSESIKTALEQRYKIQPDAATASALAKQLAHSGKWHEAQHYYFQAHAAMPEDADCVFNLAVSLDALDQTALALRYYQRALDLDNVHRGSFNRTLTQQRIEALNATIINNSSIMPNQIADE